MKTKIVMFLIFILLICTVASAEEMYSFTDDFSRTESAEYTGVGVRLDDNWSSKQTGTMDGNGTGVTKFGFDGESIVVSSFKQDAYPKVSSAQLSRMPGINWTGEHYRLSMDFEINISARKSHNVNMWGVKFMQHNNEKNYYLLYLGGQYSYQMTSGLISWGLYKVENGNVTILEEQLQSEDETRKYIGTLSDAKLNLIYNNGEISFTVEYNGDKEYYKGTYKDENPYIVYGNNSGVQLVASSCGNSAYPIYFKDFAIFDKNEILKDNLYRYTESFEKDATEYLSGTGVVIDDNWSSKQTGTMNGDGTGTTTFRIDGESLVVNTFKQDTYPKISSSQLSKMPGFNWTAEHTELEENIKIQTTVKKSHNVNMWGVKFMQHNNEQNYYLLYFGGQYSYQLSSGLISWGLYKVENGNVTILKEQLQSENETRKYIGTLSDAKLNLIYNNGEISFTVEYNGDKEYYKGTYKDENPYIVCGNDSGVQLVASSCGNSAYPIYFKDVKIESYYQYLTDGEPDNMMYIEVSKKIDKNVIETEKSCEIKKIVYSGSVVNDVIYVSNDGKNYDKLAYISDFKNGVWTNTSTAKKFRYLMFSDAKNLKIFESAKEYTVPVNSPSLNTYPRIDGVDVLAPVLECDDSFVLTTDGNILTPSGVGTARVSSGDMFCDFNITNDKVYYSSKNELSNAYNKIYTGSGFSIGEWRSKNAADGSMGKDNNAAFGAVNNKLRLYGSSNAEEYDFNIQYGLNNNSHYYPALISERQIQGDTTIKLNFKKSHATQTVGIKLLENKEQGISYTLWFPGMNSYGSCWMIYKEQGGSAECVAQGTSITDNTAGASGYIADEEAMLRIDIVDNKISFLLNYNDQYTITGEYTENSGLPKEGMVWLMVGAKASNPVSDKRYVDFYNIRFSHYNEREKEKSAVMYYDAAADRILNGNVIDLGKSIYISRFDIENADANVVVSVSEDNNRYFNVAKEDTYNSDFTGKYRYVKISGGMCDLKVLADASLNVVNSHIGDTIYFYPYVGGAVCTADSWTCTNPSVYINKGEVSSDNLVKTASLTAVCGDEHISASFSFDYLDYNVELDKNTYYFDIPGLAGESVTVVVAWYDVDGFMKKVNNYDITIDGYGNAEIKTGGVFGAGGFSKIFVMRSLKDTLPLTNVKTIY